MYDRECRRESSLQCRPAIFVSYHHARDEVYYERFRHRFVERLQLLDDVSLKTAVDSTERFEIEEMIREDCLLHADCTLVLCGAETYTRPWVDWEIRLSLDLNKALVAVELPGLEGVLLPSTLKGCIDRGHAVSIAWERIEENANLLLRAIRQAICCRGSVNSAGRGDERVWSAMKSAIRCRTC